MNERIVPKRNVLHLPAAVVLLGVGLLACSRFGPPSTDYLHGHPSRVGRDLINVVVEIPAGTNDKWEVDKTSGALRWEKQEGRPRVIQYLAYPANYGMIPRTRLPKERGGDGDPLDVLLLGPQVERGTLVQARPIGVLRLTDDGERDDKIVAVPVSGPLSDVADLKALESRYGGVRLILETWFTNYKGPDHVTSTGFGAAPEAMAVVREATRFYEQSTHHGP